jgi:hypothetical protein
MSVKTIFDILFRKIEYTWDIKYSIYGFFLYSIIGPVKSNPNIKFSDKLAIFDIWLRNFEYTGRFPYIQSYGAGTPISNSTGRGYFVTYIRYSATGPQNDHIYSKLHI